MEGYGNYVEICGERFPAVNIQIWECSPELHRWDIGGDTYWFGIYFEMMFESGTTVVVSQEASAFSNGEGQSKCSSEKNFLEHFVVEEYRTPRTPDPCYKRHCSGEEELVTHLKNIKRGEAWIDGAPKMVFKVA